MTEFAVFADMLDVDLLGGVGDAARKRAASQALNKVARDARAQAAKAIREQVNLPASYVAPAQRRLWVSKNATPGNLESKVSAQGRATSLARFVTGPARPGKAGVYVEVKPGAARFMKRAFLIRLPSGTSPVTDTQFNLGLAIRLRPGETLQNKMAARRVENGLYVLFGPSVSQVFRDNSGDGVANQIAPKAARDLESEFLRLLGL